MSTAKPTYQAWRIIPPPATHFYMGKDAQLYLYFDVKRVDEMVAWAEHNAQAFVRLGEYLRTKLEGETMERARLLMSKEEQEENARVVTQTSEARKAAEKARLDAIVAASPPSPHEARVPVTAPVKKDTGLAPHPVLAPVPGAVAKMGLEKAPPVTATPVSNVNIVPDVPNEPVVTVTTPRKTEEDKQFEDQLEAQRKNEPLVTVTTPPKMKKYCEECGCRLDGTEEHDDECAVVTTSETIAPPQA